MNKLMRFNPPTFDLDSSVGLAGQAAALEQEYEAFEQEDEALAQEDEVRSRAGGGFGRSKPAAGKSMSGFRAATKGRLGKTSGSGRFQASSAGRYQTPSAPQTSWPKRRKRRWDVAFGTPIGAYADEPGARYTAALPSDYVAWIQTQLNEALGLRLTADGVLDAPTRSAIRLFQERNGLVVNGRVGPETEAALRGGAGGPAPASRSRPPRPSAGPPAGTADEPDANGAPSEDAGEPEGELDADHVPSRRTAGTLMGSATAAPRSGIKTLRANIVRIAQQEAARWKDGGLKETGARTTAALRDYWKTGAGLTFTKAQLGSKSFQDSHPWSAAFVSWVMRKAGAGADFKYSASHSIYISAAKANRIAGNSSVFKAYRLNEVAPRAGDLICRSRAGSHATYDTIRPGMKTHCDIVVAVAPGALKVIGGNVDNSVKTRTVKIDKLGRVTQPLAFAVIRVGSHTPPMPGATPAPAPSPTPASDPAPSAPAGPGLSPTKLLKQETVPPAGTLYAEIDLGIVDRFGIRARPMTGIFLPDGFTPAPSVDVILYLHGFKDEKIAIDEYWNARHFPYGAFREKLNEAGRRAILVAPTLGARSEAGQLVEPGGLDSFMAKILSAIGAAGLGGRGAAPALRHLVLACHSGGGKPMRMLAGARNKAGSNLRECWGFDCTYNSGDDTFWAGWARKTPDAKCYFYYIEKSPTAKLSESLKALRIGNAIVQPARDKRHNYVPITHWLDRIQGAAFLGPLAGGGSVPPGQPPGEPADLKTLSHEAFINFVGSRARMAMAETGVPASVTVAQAILETGWGKHTIGSAKNLFGIKGKGPAGSVRAPTREFVAGKWITIEADFAKYDDFAQSITEHARFFLKHKRYAPALKVKNDADAFARALATAGYATAPDYAEQLINLMRRHDLYRFDQPAGATVQVAAQQSTGAPASKAA